MNIIAISIGQAAPLFIGASGRNEQVMSGIRKTPVSTPDDPQPVEVRNLGLVGDEQADLTVHGGRDKAVYAYPAEHYPVWNTLRLQALKVDEQLPFGAMGENLTLRGLLETQVWIGDVLTIGAVRLRVSAPRSPCFKFNARMGFRHAAKMMVQSGYTGFYLEVEQTGSIRAGDAITLTAGDRQVRVDEMHRHLTRGRQTDLF